MALPAKRIERALRGPMTESALMRLVRFPAVRRAISGGLERAQPERVDIPKAGAFVRFRLEDPGKFHPALFSVIRIGKRGTLATIGTRRDLIRKKAALEAFLRRMGWDSRGRRWTRRMGVGERRSMIYQLRQGGIIGGSRTQSVLVPRARVEAVAARFLARPAFRKVAGANPYYVWTDREGKTHHGAMPGAISLHRMLGQTLRVRRRMIGRSVSSVSAVDVNPRSNPILATMGIGNPGTAVREDTRRRLLLAKVTLDGEPATITGVREPFAKVRSLISARQAEWSWEAAKRIVSEGGKFRSNPRRTAKAGRRVAMNPSGAIRIPFRTGQKVRTATIERWLRSLPEPFRSKAIRRYAQGKEQYKRFHLGPYPKTWTFKPQGLGVLKAITDIDFVVSEGKEWAAPYQVPSHSGKYDPKVQGRYVHAHGESKMDIDIKRAAPRGKLPERFHTPDGRFVGVVPTRNVKITDWYRG